MSLIPLHSPLFAGEGILAVSFTPFFFISSDSPPGLEVGSFVVSMFAPFFAVTTTGDNFLRSLVPSFAKIGQILIKVKISKKVKQIRFLIFFIFLCKGR